MNSKFLLSAVALSISYNLMSCSPDIEEIDQKMEDQIIVDERIVYQSSLTYPTFFNGDDPNINPLWTWMDKMLVKVYYTSSIDQDVDREISLPWKTMGNPLTVGDPDIKPEDGWAFAFKDFGTTDRRPRMPILSMYNGNTQVLRLFIYNSQRVAASFFKGEMVLKEVLDGNREIFRGEAKAVANSHDAWINFEYEVTGFTVPFDNDNFIMEVTLSGIVETIIHLPGN